jgi:hypothetical protein
MQKELNLCNRCSNDPMCRFFPSFLRSSKQHRDSAHEVAKTSSTIILGRDITIASITPGSCLSPWIMNSCYSERRSSSHRKAMLFLKFALPVSYTLASAAISSITSLGLIVAHIHFSSMINSARRDAKIHSRIHVTHTLRIILILQVRENWSEYGP